MTEFICKVSQNASHQRHAASPRVRAQTSTAPTLARSRPGVHKQVAFVTAVAAKGQQRHQQRLPNRHYFLATAFGCVRRYQA
jgi:hypothetical protein